MTGKRSTTVMSRKKRKENCNKYRKKQQQGESYLRLVHSGNDLHRIRQKQVQIKPRNFSQDDLLGHLEDPNTNIVFAVGPAGTGKTMISTLAGIRGLQDHTIDKFVVTRPAVSADEDLGFLPGTLEEKMAPWTRPIFDVFREYFYSGEIESMIKEGVIEISPLAYMRGRTFKDAYIIADEMQNATPNQMKMLLTRIGSNSQMAVTGDLAQADRLKDNGLIDFITHLERKELKHIDVCHFNSQDIERHEAVKEVLEVYGDV